MAAFSFGFWRFATENENYIFPILFSLLGSYYFIKSYAQKKYDLKYILASGLFATIACLYHQIHIFWFIGLFFGWIWIDKTSGLKRGILFAGTFIIAPVIYFLVILFYLHQNLSWFSVTRFVFHDYYIGAAGNTFGFNNVLLGAINFIRTFFQVHGQMLVMISRHKIWLLPGVIAIGFMIRAIIDLTTFKKLSNLKGPKMNIIVKIHLLILLLQLAFAVYNIGNAEFMIMIPALLAIILVGMKRIPMSSLAFIAVAMLIWNFTYGIYPNNSLHFNADAQVTAFVIEHPKDKFIASEPAIILNQYYYQEGHWPENVWPGPDYYKLHGPVSELKTKIDSALKSGGNIYTDCTGRPEVMSRGSMLFSSKDFFKPYNLKNTVATFETDAGKHVIVKIYP